MDKTKEKKLLQAKTEDLASAETKKKEAQIINCTHLNLRKVPDTKGDILEVLQTHSHVVIEREVNTIWTKVQVDGTTGFVMSKYIEVV